MGDEIKIPAGIASILGKQITEEQLFKGLLEYAIEKKYHKGDIILDIGDRVAFLYYLKQGRLRIYLRCYFIVLNPTRLFVNGVF